MPDLSSYLNANKNKVRIGYAGLGGYEQSLTAFLSTGNEGQRLESDSTKKTGGSSGVGDLSSLSTTLIKDFIIDDQQKKQVKLAVSCAYAYPLKEKDGSYHMAASNLGNRSGTLSNIPKGIPATFDSTTIESLNPPNGNLQAGVGLDIEDWATEYMNHFFNGSTVTSKDLCILAQKNKLCAEIVIHSGTELNTSGKVFFANVVDIPSDADKTCYISPCFCFGKYKSLGLDFGFTTGYGMQTLQTTTDFEPAATPSYDYKTGELKDFGKAALQAFSSTGAKNATIPLVQAKDRCCRVRLFVSDRKEAESTIGKKLPDGFDQTNAQLEYVGGDEKIVTESSRVYSTEITEMIAQKAEDLFKLMSAQGFLYMQVSNGARISPVGSANTTEGVKTACARDGFKYAPNGLATLASERATPADKSQKWPVCDCSLFVSWVLMECGVVKSPARSTEYALKTIPLQSGFRLEEISTPERGCILAKDGHVAIALSPATLADFGGTKWWMQEVPNNRKNWEGTADSVEHGKKIQIFTSPQGIGNNFTKYWKVVKG